MKSLATNIKFSFGGCGWLLAYGLGFVRCLQRHHANVIPVSEFAGASGGALVALLASLNVDADEAHHVLMHEAYQNRSNLWQHGSNIRQILRSSPLLPNEPHQIVSNRLHIALTKLTPPHGHIVSQFKSREELIDIIVASCHIPGYTSLVPFLDTSDLGYCLDGGIAIDAPLLDEQTYCISPFPAVSPIQGVLYDVTPCAQLIGQAPSPSIPWRLRAAFYPSLDDLETMYWRGNEDAQLFFSQLWKSDGSLRRPRRLLK